jgi:hypothetical protein
MDWVELLEAIPLDLGQANQTATTQSELIALNLVGHGPGDALAVGCGDGYRTKLLKSRGFRVVCADIDCRYVRCQQVDARGVRACQSVSQSGAGRLHHERLQRAGARTIRAAPWAVSRGTREALSMYPDLRHVVFVDAAVPAPTIRAAANNDLRDSVFAIVRSCVRLFLMPNPRRLTARSCLAVQSGAT